MHLTQPAYDVLGENRVRILRRLAALATPISGRRLHELSGATSLRTTQGILRDLVQVGLVDMGIVGSAHAYSLNREHVLWPMIGRILDAARQVESSISARLHQTLGDHTVGTYLYGSFARGEADTESDVDILVVRRDDVTYERIVDLLDQAAEQIRRLTGNQAQLFPVTVGELNELVAHDDPFVVSLRQDGRRLTGRPLDDLLGTSAGRAHRHASLTHTGETRR